MIESLLAKNLKKITCMYLMSKIKVTLELILWTRLNSTTNSKSIREPKKQCMSITPSTKMSMNNLARQHSTIQKTRNLYLHQFSNRLNMTRKSMKGHISSIWWLRINLRQTRFKMKVQVSEWNKNKTKSIFWRCKQNLLHHLRFCSTKSLILCDKKLNRIQDHFVCIGQGSLNQFSVHLEKILQVWRITKKLVISMSMTMNLEIMNSILHHWCQRLRYLAAYKTIARSKTKLDKSVMWTKSFIVLMNQLYT